MESLIAAVREQDEAARFLACRVTSTWTVATTSRRSTSPRAPRSKVWLATWHPVPSIVHPVSEARAWCAGPKEPGNVFVMFFQTPIYE